MPALEPPGESPIAGFLAVDKPVGITSHDVVAEVRRITGIKKAGHAGSLDPLATGLVVVGLGRATRLLRFLTDLEKEYLAEVQFGIATDTLDADRGGGASSGATRFHRRHLAGSSDGVRPQRRGPPVARIGARGPRGRAGGSPGGREEPDDRGLCTERLPHRPSAGGVRQRHLRSGTGRRPGPAPGGPGPSDRSPPYPDRLPRTHFHIFRPE